MRKGFLILLAVVLVAAMAAPAIAGMDVSGFVRTKGYVSNFKNGATAPALRENAPDASYVEQRFRAKFSFGEENVKAVWFLETDFGAWGDQAGSTKGNPLYIYTGAASDNNAFIFFEGAWEKIQPKIADGTFVIKNSSEAIALQDKATLTRDEMSKIIGQVTTNWDFNTAKTLAEANLTAAPAADKGNVFILAPNDGTARAIADAFAADKDVTSYAVTGQDAEKASVQYIIDGKQSMTVFKDVRTLVDDAIAAAVSFLEGNTPEATNSYNNGKIDVPAKPSAIVTVTKDNVQAALIDSGYYQASDFTGSWPGKP